MEVEAEKPLMENMALVMPVTLPAKVAVTVKLVLVTMLRLEERVTATWLQVAPVKPPLQEQVELRSPSLHVPLLRQGSGLQSSIWVWHSVPS